MSWSKGYYCLIQYCPDLSRGEGANIGVLLFCPEKEFLGARMARGNDRIRRFFRSEGLDLDRINAMKGAIEDRLELEGRYITTREDLEQFIRTRANEIQITSPRPLKISDPKKNLRSLYERLVGGRARSRERRRLESRIASRFQEEGVDHLVQKNVKVDVPLFRRSLTVPFGFQNGRYNLIQPVRFVGLVRRATEANACRLATEGRSVKRHSDNLLGGRLQLMVVAQFSTAQQEESEVVRAILDESKVPFYLFGDIGRLVDEIRKTGRALPGRV